MFGKEVESNVQEGRLNSILGKGCKFKGTIEVEGTLRIDSEFEGVVNCPETLVVGKTGLVKAEINVKNAVIGGKADRKTRQTLAAWSVSLMLLGYLISCAGGRLAPPPLRSRHPRGSRVCSSASAEFARCHRSCQSVP